jgi:hypothetical protein
VLGLQGVLASEHRLATPRDHFGKAVEVSNAIRAHCRHIEPSPALRELTEKLQSPPADRGMN